MPRAKLAHERMIRVGDREKLEEVPFDSRASSSAPVRYVGQELVGNVWDVGGERFHDALRVFKPADVRVQTPEAPVQLTALVVRKGGRRRCGLVGQT